MNGLLTDNVPANNDPWWAKLLYTYGVPSAIAVFLVWTLITNQGKALDAMTLKMSQHVTTLEEHTTLTKVSDEAAKASASRVETYLRLLCANTAHTIADRNTCLSVR